MYISFGIKDVISITIKALRSFPMKKLFKFISLVGSFQPQTENQDLEQRHFLWLNKVLLTFNILQSLDSTL